MEILKSNKQDNQRIIHWWPCIIEFIKQVEIKEIKCKAVQAFYRLFKMVLIN